MKIAVNGIFWDKPNTGSGQYLRALLQELLRRDIADNFILVTPRTSLTQPLLCLSIHSAPTPFDRLSEVWFEKIGFVRACQREHADLVHVPYFAAPLFPNPRTVVTIHDLIPMVLPLYRGSVLVRAYTQLVALGARRANAIIADHRLATQLVPRAS